MRVCVSQTSVVGVKQRADFAATGQWEVETERREGQRETRVFDAVIVCTGHFTQPHLPLSDFPGTRNHHMSFIIFSIVVSHLRETHSCSTDITQNNRHIIYMQPLYIIFTFRIPSQVLRALKADISTAGITATLRVCRGKEWW